MPLDVASSRARAFLCLKEPSCPELRSSGAFISDPPHVDAGGLTYPCGSAAAIRLMSLLRVLEHGCHAVSDTSIKGKPYKLLREVPCLAEIRKTRMKCHQCQPDEYNSPGSNDDEVYIGRAVAAVARQPMMPSDCCDICALNHTCTLPFFSDT